MTDIARIQSLHRPSFIAGTLAIVVLTAIAAPGALVSGPALALWAIIIALLGLPHGAFDLQVARSAGLAKSPAAIGSFALGYLALAVAFGLLWKTAPAPWLILFLAISAVHFSEDWAGELPWWGRMGAGCAIIALPAMTHQTEVAQVFSRLIPASPAFSIAEALSFAALPALGITLLAAAVNHQRHRGLILEIVAITALAIVLPPLLYFVAYFCGMHSLRQTLNTATHLGAATVGTAIRMAAPITIVTLLGVAAILPGLGASPDEQLLRAVFVGLACLTVPHMALNLWIELGQSRSERLAGSSQPA